MWFWTNPVFLSGLGSMVLEGIGKNLGGIELLPYKEIR